jgi:hypothetical protein
MALVQGPGLVDAGMNAAMAGSPEESRGILGTAAHELYRHPLRNAIYTYTAMPWTIGNITSKGLKWPGLIGYRGLAGGKGWAPWATTPIRRGVGALGSALTRGWSPEASAGFAEFGARGLQGLGQKYNSSIWKGLSTAIAGGEAGHFGMFGYGWTGGVSGGVAKGSMGYAATAPWANAFVNSVDDAWAMSGGAGGIITKTGTIGNLTSDFFNASKTISAEWGTTGNAIKWLVGGRAGRSSMTRAMATSAAKATMGPGVGFGAAARNFLNLNAFTKVATGAAYISLAADITKFAAKTTYKLVDAGISSANNMMQDIVNQEWGGRMSAAYITSGATSERQRALSEINRSSLNARSLLGNEAGLAARTYLGGRIV